ncbi:MAG TPA: GAF domain-containing protein [Anaerolineaceae bacterium]|nr:GAF domain-containing protein [Anaerolineaceae bacterium]HPN52734.1 GAF domain-containing protein [Anaerolineaceae bacterium]
MFDSHISSKHPAVKFGQIAVMAYLLVALIIFATMPILALTWINQPFLGGFLEQTLSFTSIGSIGEIPWPAYEQGLTFGDRLTEIDGMPVSNAEEISSILLNHRPGETVQITVIRQDNSRQSLPITLIPFPRAAVFSHAILPYMIGLVYLICALWIFILRRSDSQAQAFVLFSTSAALTISATFDLHTTHRLVYFWTFAVATLGASIIHLAFFFPRPPAWVKKLIWPAYLPYLISIGLFIYSLFTLYDFSHPFDYAASWRLEYLFAGLSFIGFIVWIIFSRMRGINPIEREQTQAIIYGMVIALTPITIWLIAISFNNGLEFSPYLLIPTPIFPIVLAYIIQKYRLIRTDYLLSRATLYLLITIVGAAGYALLVTGINLILVEGISPTHPFLVGVIIFLVAIFFNPLRQKLQKMVDGYFFRGEQAYQEKLHVFGRELTSAINQAEIIQTLAEYIKQPLMPERLHIFLLDPATDQYSAPVIPGNTASDLRFSEENPLIQYLSKTKVILFISDQRDLPVDLEPERSRLALLNSQLFVPIPGQNKLVGWFAIGPRSSGEPYLQRDLKYLESLANQSSLALERAQVLSNMETNMRDMNTLSRVAQGVNITVEFDDILELIYAQISQVIPTVDFLITLFEPQTNLFRHVFVLREDERLTSLENKPFPGGQSLEQEVIINQRAIITDDYQAECQRRKINTTSTSIYAWMGVPLNAGARTIGAISLGSRNPSTVFTAKQLGIMQAIADQAAGAIVKARLLQETEHRARQMATLNEMSRRLTSTLEIEPLLETILQNAADILNCSAGSLLLHDEQTNELVFRMAVGPVANELIGKRMPSDTGIVGECFTRRQPVIVNSAQNSSAWFSGSDAQTGFATQALIATPLEVKDKIIGVLEVLNRRDGMPFSDDDLNLLSAFASQAGIAIENARLYMMTDQALAARVEELSVMQRIDRELNTSLDINQAMRITLEWAMRQSQVNAGLVATIEETTIRIMASQGYATEMDEFENGLIPLQRIPALEEIISSGQIQQVLITPEHKSGLLPSAKTQLVLPIRREGTTIGVILLESDRPEPAAQESVNFLNRLSDHAAIAISNAKLYAAIQAANTAKSEFVSFVAHELKNPMTSIKGYTELLAAGAVGPINDPQKNFLSTIRSNVERMSTLVSDLNDVSRIEANRLRLDFKATKTNEVVDEVVRSLRRQIEEKEQQLVNTIPSDLPDVWADRSRLLQVITNLISNAIKYTPKGGQFEISAERCANQWDPGGAAEVVHLWVKDNGIGIAPEDQKKIFQKFFRSEDPKTREAPGTGLGLNITKSLVEMQGGKIWFESEFRQGTTFHITIPISQN